MRAPLLTAALLIGAPVFAENAPPSKSLFAIDGTCVLRKSETSAIEFARDTTDRAASEAIHAAILKRCKEDPSPVGPDQILSVVSVLDLVSMRIYTASGLSARRFGP